MAMDRPIWQYLLAVLLAAVIAGVAVIDVVLFPVVLLPGPFYASFVLVAAFFLDFPLVLGLAVWAVALHVAALFLHPQLESWTSTLVVVGTAIIAGLSAVLSWQRHREAALRARTESARAQAEEAAALAQEQAQELEAANEALAEERQRLEALQHVTEVAISSLPLDELLRELLARLRAVLAAETASILLLTEDGQNVAARASSGLEEEEEAHVLVPMGRGIAGRVAASGAPLVVNDLAAEEVVSPLLREKVCSLLGAPLLADGRTIGVVYVGTVRCRHFGADDVRLLQLVADRAALVIERRRAEQALRESGDGLNRAQGVAQTGSWRLDVRSNILLWSDETYRIFGIARGTPLTYETFLAAVHPEDRARVDDAWQAALRGAPYDIEHRTLVGDEVKWVRERCEMDFDAQGVLLGGFGTVQDITERKETEAERERLLREVQRRAAEMEDFIRTISHDLRQPLTVITGMADWLRHRLEQAELAREAQTAGRVLASARRMGTMIQDLVDSARLEAGQMEMRRETLDLLHLTLDVVPRLGSPEEQRRIQVEAPQWVPPVPADPEKTERVLVNLITNALKYSAPDKPVVVRLEARDQEAVVSVIDQGVGVPAEEVPLLFRRYFRARTGRRTEGLGLGLYITRLIVEAHGGRIWCESEEGKGSTFAFALPATNGG